MASDNLESNENAPNVQNESENVSNKTNPQEPLEADELEALGLTPEELAWIRSDTFAVHVADEFNVDAQLLLSQSEENNPAISTNLNSPKRNPPIASKFAHSDLQVRFPACIGELAVTVLALSKGPGVVAAGDAVFLSRSASGSASSSRKRSRNRTSGSSSAFGASARKLLSSTNSAETAILSSPDNCIVRVVLERTGSEIGRIASDSAAFIATLIDQNICTFRGSILYAPTSLRTFDEIFITLEAQFIHQAFMPSSSHNAGAMDDDRPESSARALARKVALRTLFIRTGLMNDTGVIDLDNEETQSKPEAKNAFGLSQADPEPATVTPTDLAVVYKKANRLGHSSGRMQPRNGMRLDLRCYQTAALSFMHAKENQSGMNSSGMSPLWRRYLLPSGAPFYYNPYSGELNVEFPRENHCSGGILADEMGLGKTIEMLSLIHTSRRDLVYPDDVQTPRTIRVSAFNAALGIQSENVVVPMTQATLIVCPLNLLAQWRDEIERAFEPDLIRCEVYYGADRGQTDRHAFVDLHSPTLPIVLTTYGNLSGDFSKHRNDSPLFNVHWHRIVLDEAHYIKERATLSARAAYALMASHRWAVTGTPIINNINDLYSLIRFLRVEPWCRYSFWSAFVAIPFERNRDPSALEVPQTILEPLLLRRTKDMRDENGNLVIDLPPKHIETRYLDLSQEEREIYESLTRHSKHKLYELKIIGKADYLHVFQLLLRLRQACDHPLLIKARDTTSSITSGDADATDADGKGTHAATQLTGVVDLDELLQRYCENVPKEFATRVLNNLFNNTSESGNAKDGDDDSNNECPICFETIQNNVLLPCLHVVCQACVDDVLSRRETSGEGMDCPICRKPCTESEIIRIMASSVDQVPSATANQAATNPDDNDDEDDETKSQTSSQTQSQSTARKVVLQPMDFRSSTKLDALIRDIVTIRTHDHTIKSIVFSQWTSMLDIVEAAFKFHDIKFVRIDGSLSQRAREKVLAAFADTRPDHGAPILLASLRSTGVGLNLTMASRVFMLEPWWNQSVEFQAIDRVHRLGQTRPVFVTRYIIGKSVEEKMLAIQSRKAHLAGAVTSAVDTSKIQLDELVSLLD